MPFRMSYSDFIKQFSRLEICNLTPDTLMSDDVGRWNHYQFEGMWRVGSTAGGCRNNPGESESTSSAYLRQTSDSKITFFCACVPATFTSNPQFVIRLEDVDDDPIDGKDGCTFLVGLMQKDGRKQKSLNNSLETIGFAIYKVFHATVI